MCLRIELIAVSNCNIEETQENPARKMKFATAALSLLFVADSALRGGATDTADNDNGGEGQNSRLLPRLAPSRA